MLKEQLQKQIEQEAKSSAADFNYYPESTECEDLESSYATGASRYAALWQAAEEKANRYEKALKEIRAWELTTGSKIKVKHLDILKDIMETVNKSLTPKTSEDGR